MSQSAHNNKHDKNFEFEDFENNTNDNNTNLGEKLRIINELEEHCKSIEDELSFYKFNAENTEKLKEVIHSKELLIAKIQSELEILKHRDPLTFDKKNSIEMNDDIVTNLLLENENLKRKMKVYETENKKEPGYEKMKSKLKKKEEEIHDLNQKVSLMETERVI